MDLADYLTILRRRKWPILVFAALVLATAYIGSHAFTQRAYNAATTLQLSTAAVRAGDGVRFDDVTYADRLMNTYARIANSDRFRTALARTLHVEHAPKVSLALTANTELMELSAQAATPRLAQRAANNAATLLLHEIRAEGRDSALSGQLRRMESDLSKARKRAKALQARPSDSAARRAADEEVEARKQAIVLLVSQFEQSSVAEAVRAAALTVAQPAARPTTPVAGHTKILMVVALLLGLLGGAALAFLLERFDTRLHSTRDIRSLLQAPLVVTVPAAERRALQRNHGLFDDGSPQQEAVRRLRTYLAALPMKTLMVTSAAPREGKTTIAANVAAAAAGAGQKTIVIDCDLRRPSLHAAFGLPNEVGLTDVLRGHVRLADAVQRHPELSLHVLTSGSAVDNAADLLSSRSIDGVLAELSQRFELVVVDTPAFVAVADAAAIEAAVDGIVVVAGRGIVHEEALLKMIDELKTMGADIKGLVVNRAERDAIEHHYYYPRRNLRIVGGRGAASAEPEQRPNALQ